MIDWKKPLCFADTTGDMATVIEGGAGGITAVKDFPGRIYVYYTETGVPYENSGAQWGGKTIQPPRPIMNAGPFEVALAQRKIAEFSPAAVAAAAAANVAAKRAAREAEALEGRREQANHPLFGMM